MNEAGIEVFLDSAGKIGEFTVWVDELLVSKKRLVLFPDKHDILKAVQQHL